MQSLNNWISRNRPHHIRKVAIISTKQSLLVSALGLKIRGENLNDKFLSNIYFSKFLKIKPQKHLPRPCFWTSSISCSSSFKLHLPFFTSQCNAFKYLQNENNKVRNIQFCLYSSDHHHILLRLNKPSIPYQSLLFVKSTIPTPLIQHSYNLFALKNIRPHD